MVKLLLDAGADLSGCDQYHNMALHMAVLHSMPRMYNYIYGLLPPEQKSLRNKLGLTPLTLAVQCNKLSMFQHICAAQQTVVWEFGPVKCYRVPLVR